MSTVATNIKFEDHGQDFLEWDLNAQGVVVASRPYQDWVWKGKKVLNASTVKRGQKVEIRAEKRGTTSIRYPVVSVRRIETRADRGGR